MYIASIKPRPETIGEDRRSRGTVTRLLSSHNTRGKREAKYLRAECRQVAK